MHGMSRLIVLMALSTLNVARFQLLWKVISIRVMCAIRLESDTASGGQTLVACTVLKERKALGGFMPPTLKSGNIIALATVPADAYEDSRAKPFVRRKTDGSDNFCWPNSITRGSH